MLQTFWILKTKRTRIEAIKMTRIMILFEIIKAAFMILTLTAGYDYQFNRDIELDISTGPYVPILAI